MKITTHIRREGETLDDIYSLLEGRVFHVTKLTYCPSILADGEIKPNKNSTLPTTFGSSTNDFFRNRNCVSLFDYRLEPTKEIIDFRQRCRPFQPAMSCEEGIAILLLKPEVHADLIPWTRWNEENALGERIVPYVEAGYSGPISIDLIDEIIFLTIEEDPNSHAALLRKASRRKGHLA